MHMKKIILAVVAVFGGLLGVGNTEAYTVNMTPVYDAPQFAVLKITEFQPEAFAMNGMEVTVFFEGQDGSPVTHTWGALAGSLAGVSGSDGFRGLRLRQDSDRAEV